MKKILQQTKCVIVFAVGICSRKRRDPEKMSPRQLDHYDTMPWSDTRTGVFDK